MSNIITLPENMTIHQIDQHFNVLNQQFMDSDEVITIDAALIEAIDTAGLQTLLLLVQNALQNSKQISWLNTPDVLLNAAQKLGLSEGLTLS
ncbi:STAS domain-containing protein [Thiomicrorhabdus aquaedulcis]|uniref:STAS domain-containing protein n=1 Tax=Thiomicrorhabdus aquaedulcis TaxID=2211106 RepID=UPI000FDBD486|nr:STAS domain-containing protein [Thiomicrorhabdus aquaedulcis]